MKSMIVVTAAAPVPTVAERFTSTVSVSALTVKPSSPTKLASSAVAFSAVHSRFSTPAATVCSDARA
ncbi:MAG: hypothetical protein AAB403_22515, partial [Planctomycetota bacterium]